ncbi:MAG TPA: hypothetical protein VG537_11175 [Candidatus Kapabacteria bacterium]|jgi:hypothetical protein|nr:hypothetical protein [Candidatus Kapabacteria bacterium]
MKFKFTIVLVLLSFSILTYGRGADARGAGASKYHLDFREGDIHRVVITEVLRLEMHFPQVDSDQTRPSVRTSNYSFTETVQKVLPDGSAIIGATLDSFKTAIAIGEGANAEDFFHFNSAYSGDIEHFLHDIKVLPRAQFLGQTLLFTMRQDGTIHDFQNLQSFHDDAVGKGYDYDMVHAMLSLTDSLRIGQLLELGFGGLAGTGQQYTSLSTATEIPITRSVTSRSNRNSITVRATYFEPPKNIDYLEGIATPLIIKQFRGGGMGTIEMKDNFITHSIYRDTANVFLGVDIDNVPEEITRIVTTDVYPVAVLRGGTVSIKEIEVHKGTPKDPNAEAMKRMNVIDPETGKIYAPDSTRHPSPANAPTGNE